MGKYILFLSTFFVIYGSIHWVAFRWMQTAKAFPRKVELAVLGWMTMMIGGPVLIPYLGFVPWPPVKTAIAAIVYTWMGFLFIFFVWSLILTTFKWLLFGVFRLFNRHALVSISPRSEFLLHLGVTLGLLLYGFYEASNPILEKIEIADARIPSGSRVRMVLICDVHLGIMENTQRLERVLRLVREAKPDLLLAAGDMVDVELSHRESLIETLKAVQPPLGKLATLGNHEAYADLPASIDFLSRSGFTLLRGASQHITPFLTVVGFDDPAAEKFGGGKVDEVNLLKSVDPGRFLVLIRHAPKIGTGTRDLFDLQVSGHTHGGQIWPFSAVIGMEFDAKHGFSRIGQRSSLYLSRGSATFGPPVRIFTPPEVTIIDLVPVPETVTSHRNTFPNQKAIPE